MQRPGQINHLETYLAVVYFDLPAASWATIEYFLYSFDLAGLIERYNGEVRWRTSLSLADHLDCSVDKCRLHDPDLLMRNFVESPRSSVELEGLAGLAAVPLNPACMTLEKPDSALDSFENTGQQGEAPATVPMMVG